MEVSLMPLPWPRPMLLRLMVEGLVPFVVVSYNSMVAFELAVVLLSVPPE